jgi:dihydropteroate synthase
VVGILNVTPDSFSDGGQYVTGDAAIARAVALIEQGADIIDVGGESTRPGATSVDADTEIRRVLPIIERILREVPGAVLSIDTTKTAVARAAIDAGVHIVNDVSALRFDPGIAGVCGRTGTGLVLMHSRGEDITELASFEHATYVDVGREVRDELAGSIALAREAGVAPECIAVDPGIGFAKKSEHSLDVLHALPMLAALGLPILVGVSNKRFIGEITGVREPAARVSGTLGACVSALALGARIFRVHEVRAAREALDVAWAIVGARSSVFQPEST